MSQGGIDSRFSFRGNPLVRQQRLFFHLDRSSLQRVPTEIIPSPPHPSRPRLSRLQLLLHNHGIKARDFAYESTLPPVPATKPIASAQHRWKPSQMEDHKILRRNREGRPYIIKYTSHSLPGMYAAFGIFTYPILKYNRLSDYGRLNGVQVYPDASQSKNPSRTSTYPFS